MTIIGFNFTKIDVLRKGRLEGQINISNNVGIKDVRESKVELGKASQSGIRFTFEFSSSYEPDVGHINIEGEVIYVGSDKKVKDIASMWKKSKKVPQDVMTEVLANVLTKSNVEALILSRDVNLPPPIPMPKVNRE